MTRKDYVFLTDEFKSELEFWNDKIQQDLTANVTIETAQRHAAKRDAIAQFAHTFGKQLKLNNPAFDFDRWQKEVGL